VTLYNAVAGGRVGERVSAGGVFGAPSGTLPYQHRIATAAAGSVTSPVHKPVAAALGVGTDGASHLTLFADGKMLEDRVLKTDWADAQGLVATVDAGARQVTVLAFHAGGTVTRLVIGAVGVGAAPTVGAPAVVASLPGVSAATLANPGAANGIWAYVVAGDRLVLVKVPAGGTGTVAQLVSSGLAGTTTLGRLTTSATGAGGVAAWSASGAGTVYSGPNPYAALTATGVPIPLPR
jgi:hypothetical protein